MRACYQKIVCPKCGREISKPNFDKHLRGHENHPENYTENVGKYKLDHNGLICKFCGKECKNRNGLCIHERLCKENPNRQESPFVKYNTERDRVWNKGLTKETDDRVAKGATTYRVNYEQGLIVSTRKGKSLPENVRAKISSTCLKKSKEGTWHKSLAKDMHYNYNGIDLDGSWEYKYAAWLDANQINWSRNTVRFEYFFDNETHYYTPDFYLIDTETFIEIKGYKTEKDDAKWRDFPSDKKLIILFEQDLKLLGVL